MMIFLLALLFTYVNSPVVDMRHDPSKDSKVETQAIYSERVSVLEEQNDWTKIETADAAVGWTPKSALYQTDKPFPDEKLGSLVVTVNRLAAHVFRVADTEYGPLMTLPFESKLIVLEQPDGPNGRWIKVQLLDGSEAYIQRGDVVFNLPKLTVDQALAFSLRFLNLPYTWGGRSSFGYDCSGYVQMIYRQMGYTIPRNSRDQIKWEGFQEVPLNALQPGDLVFFGPENRITHVVFYLGDDQFIHATVKENRPYVHISNINTSDWNGTGLLVNRAARRLNGR